MLKLARPGLHIVAAEPEEAELLAGKEWSPHKIQGWTPDFIPTVINREIYDSTMPVGFDESVAAARNLAQQEGIFYGTSGGATMAAALKVAETAPEGSTLLVMLPDTAERYLSTPLFDGIEEGSDDDWLATL